MAKPTLKTIKNKVDLRKTAKQKGILEEGQTLSKQDINESINSKNPVTQKRAILARTRKSFRNK